MGAPGSHVWQGQTFAHNLRTDLANSTSAVNPHSEDDSYLGYSLALGRFSSGSTSAPEGADVAIGIPRGADLAGKVMLVDKEMRTVRNITGEQVGAYFGYSLATVDLNGDGLDDLAIGAPLYYNATHKGSAYLDQGRVYIAYQNFRHEFQVSTRLDGTKNRGRFGTSLANCGDLNRDGIQDLAVGAPYDGPEGRGAVYIFLGRKGGPAGEADQVIYAESIRNEAGQLRAFGFSLSAGLDLDGNQYPDLLVGDYQSDRAILLKTRPVINVNTTLSFQPENFNLDVKTCLLPDSTTSVSCITVQYCIKYSGINVDPRTNFVFDIRLDTENKGAPRLFFLSNEGKNEDRNSTTLTKDVQQCRSFKAYLTRQIRDKLTPLKVEIDYNLADSGVETYDYATGAPKLKPTLNRAVSNRMSKIATIQKNCGPDNVCVPDLKLSVTPNSDRYIMGSNEKIILDVTVRNYGEDAFESMFYLTMPMSINYNNINKTRSDYPVCYGAKPDQTGDNVLICDLGNPQVANDVIKFSVITEPARGVFSTPDFTFLATVNSTNPEQDDKHREDNIVVIGIPIKVDTNLVLSGNSQPPLIARNSTRSLAVSDLEKPVSESDLGPEVYHVYQLQNRGSSTINDIAVAIIWPNKTKTGDYLLYPVDEPFTNDKVRCRPMPEASINPLKLKYVRGNPTRSSNSSQQKQPSSTYSMPSFGLRAKRQTTIDQTEYPSTTVDESVIQLACGSTKCDRFECNVVNLGHNEIATIKIRSRLVEETLNQVSNQEYGISSKLIAQVKALPNNVSTLSYEPYVYKLDTVIHTTGLTMAETLPWWLIILAILLGISLFILLAWFFKYVSRLT